MKAFFKKYRIPLIGVAIILLAVIIIVSAELAPLLAAKRQYRGRLATIAEATEIDYISVSRPRQKTDDPLSTGTETRFTGDEALTLAHKLLPLLSALSYSAREDAIAGDWDMRLRFHIGDEYLDFFVRADAAYISNGSTRYLFTDGTDTVLSRVAAVLGES